MTLAEMSLVVAREKLGIKEATGNNDGPFIRMIQRIVARGYKWLDNQKWCCIFVTWAIHEAAKRMGITAKSPYDASCTSYYKWLKKNGHLLDHAEPFCIGFVPKKNGAPETFEHVFFVGGPDPFEGEWMWTLEGNLGNKVTRNKRRIAGYKFAKIV
jgi:hypothetical protein